MQKCPKKVAYLMMFAGVLSVATVLASIIAVFYMMWTWKFVFYSVYLFIFTIVVNGETLKLNSDLEKKYYGENSTT